MPGAHTPSEVPQDGSYVPGGEFYSTLRTQARWKYVEGEKTWWKNSPKNCAHKTIENHIKSYKII
jgi:hypothetical protein